MRQDLVDASPGHDVAAEEQGQASALERALEQESDCAAVLQQIASIRGAVNGLMAQVLEGHLRAHLAAED